MMKPAIKIASANRTNTPPSDPLSGTPATMQLFRTMKIDAAEAIRTQGESLTTIALAEQRKRIAREEALRTSGASGSEELTFVTPRKVPRPAIIAILVSSVTLVGALAYFIIPKLSELKAPSISLPSFGSSSGPLANVPLDGTQQSLLQGPSEKHIDVTKNTPENIFKTIIQERSSGNAVGYIKNLYLTENSTTKEGIATSNSISSSRLLALAGVRTPEVLAFSLGAFKLGFLGETGNIATPFLALSVSDHDIGIAGMLELEQDLPRFFDTVFGTKFRAAVVEKPAFHDIVMLKRDARGFEVSPNIGIFYIFSDPSTVIITATKTALEKLVSTNAGR